MISKPTEPPITCPIIDQAKAHADNILRQIDRDEVDTSDIEYEARTLKDVLEELRQANENLREWGRSMERLYDELLYQQERLAD